MIVISIVVVIVLLIYFLLKKRTYAPPKIIKDRYSLPEMHEGMLQDSHRMDTYNSVLTNNPSLIKGKRVLDVGCGTGVLGAFAKKGGASKVVGVDMNNVPKYTGTNDIEFILGKPIQEATLPKEKFDVVVSEWMGMFLYEELSIDMFLYARDHHLKPGGALLPDMGTIYVSGFKGDKYGKPGCYVIDYVEPSDIITPDYPMHHVDFTNVSLKDTFIINSDIELKGDELIDGIVIWFDVAFTERFCKETPAILNTKRPTSWFHAVVRFEYPKKPSDIKNIKLKRGKQSYTVWVNDINFPDHGLNLDWYERTKQL
jgi:SAM-dependent methyltransferase